MDAAAKINEKLQAVLDVVARHPGLASASREAGVVETLTALMQRLADIAPDAPPVG